MRIDRIGPVGREAAGAGEEAERVDRGQPKPGRKRDDGVAMDVRQRARRQDQAAIGAVRDFRHGAFDLVFSHFHSILTPLPSIFTPTNSPCLLPFGARLIAPDAARVVIDAKGLTFH